MLVQGSGFEATGGSEFRFPAQDDDNETIVLRHGETPGRSAEVDTISDAAMEQSDLQAQLLAALSTMALRSKRRQADLTAALRRSGLNASREMVSAALCELEASGCIEHMVPLYDGGMIVSVTSRGIEHLNAGPCWTKMDLQRRA